MTLRAFQHALSDLVMSRHFCTAVQADPSEALAAYDLDARERERLAAIARQPGVRVSAMIHRSFKVGVLAGRLPLTCAVLGPNGIARVIGGYLAEQMPRTMYFNQEIRRFGASVLEQIARGALDYPYLEEVLRLEIALVELGDAPPLAADAPDALPEQPGAHPAQLDPQFRVLRFAHDPTALLPALRAKQVPSALPEGDYWMLLGCPSGQRMQMSLLDPALGALLARCDGTATLAALSEQLDVALDRALALVEAGVLRVVMRNT
ncbi:MAG TPA: hypothetical protein VFS21_33470 [Roseiflexaceae bacterium]|nr:hypothetical protein [Roseiflexaceae bacterium]